jgi:magnesium transporter
VAHTRVYCKGVLEAEDFPVADISEYLERPDTVVWVDYCAPSPEEMEELKEELGFHELAVEDALDEHQRPKVERYPGHLFMVCHAVHLDETTGDFATAEIDAFINSRWLVTVRKDEGFPLDLVLARWDKSQSLASHGVSYLLYGLLDVVIDGYFQPIDAFNGYYDGVSDKLLDDLPLRQSDYERTRWFRTRRSLIEFHRVVMPMREAVSSLMRHEEGLVPDELYPYYQDVYDHILRLTDSSEAVREFVSTIVETNINLRDYHSNQIMKKVTSWAAIIAVPTLITGWYGMNVPYPGFARHWGVWAATLLIFGLSLALYAQFKKNDWL